jgi:aminopeptidase-like protein
MDLNNQSLSLITKIIELGPQTRTIVSAGSRNVVQVLRDFFPSSEIFKFESGKHHSGWVIPQDWRLLSAFLIDLESGNTLLDHEVSPLFVAPYSQACDIELTGKELLTICLSDPERPDDFKYQHRLAYDPSRTLNEVSISLPWNFIAKNIKKENNYRLIVNVSHTPHAMEIFSHTIQGKSENCIFLLSHYCHTGQINDGLSGVLVMSLVMQYLSSLDSPLNYSYKFLSFPETIGSSVYLAENYKEIDQSIFSVFSEMAGAEGNFRLTNSRRGQSYIDRIAEKAISENSKVYTKVNFREGWGNDEMVFDSPLVGIPSISIDRFPFPQYHTSSDNLDNFSIQQAHSLAKVIVRLIDIAEKDFLPIANFQVVPQLSALNLYEDWTTNRDGYNRVATLLDAMDGQLSVFDIAIKNSLNFEQVLEFYIELEKQSLIKRRPIDPEYTRRI